MSESVNEELNRIKSNIVNTYSTLSDVGLISEGDTNSDNLANTVKNLSWGGGELCDIGLALFIDESAGMRRLLNGQILNIESKYKPFLNKLQLIATAYPNILCTETEWQVIKESSPFGQVGKFVLNYDETGENVVSVRLPAVVNLQGLQDLQYLGDKLDETLPNITTTFVNHARDYQLHKAITCLEGALQVEGTYNKSSYPNIAPNDGGSYYNDETLKFDASRCSSTYKDNAHVQQEAIQYPYYIQVNLTEYNHMIDVGQIQDMLNRIITMEKHCIIDSWSDGTEWYRVYADGWCEQGGRGALNENSTTTINLYKPFKDTNYTVSGTSITQSVAQDTEAGLHCFPINESQIGLSAHYINPNNQTACWEAKGYIAL